MHAPGQNGECLRARRPDRQPRHHRVASSEVVYEFFAGERRGVVT
jgi:hypothetical protein